MKQVQTLKQFAYENILKRLESGKLAPGVRLSDEVLCKELGVSRSPVREAILQLIGEGFVEQRPRLGAFVRVPDRKELSELFEALLALECAATGFAAERRTDRELSKLIQLTTRMEKIRDSCLQSDEPICDPELSRDFLSVDHQSHVQIVKMADSGKIAQMIRVCRVLSHIFTLAALKHETVVIIHSVEQHRRITQAIEDQDKQQATEAMASHINYSRDRVLDAYDGIDQADIVIAE